jgi:hypothetical protein
VNDAPKEKTPAKKERPRHWLGRRWDDLQTLGWAVGLLFLAAASALGLGFVNAWRSKEATTTLLVGGALLIAAVVLSREVDELRAKLGEWELFAKFRQDVVETITTSASVEEVTLRLARLEAEAEAADRRAAESHRPLDWQKRLRETIRRQDESLAPGESRVAHVFGSDKYGKDAVYLSLRYQPATPPEEAVMTCYVTDPLAERVPRFPLPYTASLK